MGAEIRAKAREVLEQELPAGIQFRSDTDGNRFEQLTGYSHATLKANWDKGGKMSTCMGYVAHYCTRLGLTPNLGRFDLDTFLPSIKKEHAWIRSTMSRRPKYGDILLHQGIHVDVSMGFDGNVLIRGAAGQGQIPRYDAVARVRGNQAYDWTKLKGWVDLELYVGVAPAAISWLKGWWQVWDGNYYFYFFGDGGFVQYTKTKPTGGQPPKNPANQGDYALEGNTLRVTWNPTGGGTTVETFHNAFPGATQMNATSNRFSPLVATRL